MVNRENFHYTPFSQDSLCVKCTNYSTKTCSKLNQEVSPVGCCDLYQHFKQDTETQKPVILGELLPQSEYDLLSNITDEDIREALEDWQTEAPDRYKQILNAE